MYDVCSDHTEHQPGPTGLGKLTGAQGNSGQCAPVSALHTAQLLHLHNTSTHINMLSLVVRLAYHDNEINSCIQHLRNNFLLNILPK